MSRKLACIIGFSVVLALLLAVSVYFLCTSPSIGVRVGWDKNLRQWKVVSAERWGVLREGDAIRSIGDIETGYSHLLESFYYFNSRKEVLEWFQARKELYRVLQDSIIPVVVSRQGQETRLIVHPRAVRGSFLFSSEIPMIFIGFFYFLVGLVIFYKKPEDYRALVLFLFCSLMSATNIVHVATISSLISLEPHFNFFLCIVQSLASFLAFVLMLHLSLLLPKRNPILDRYPALLWLTYFVGIAVIFTLELAVQHLVVALVFILIILATAYSFLTCTSSIEKQQMKWIGTGYALGLLPIMTLTALPMALTGNVLVHVNITGSCFVFIPLSMAFAIHRYRLMGIDDLLEGTVVYGITLGLLTGVDLGIVNLLSSRFGKPLELGPAGMNMISSAITISLYATVRGRVLTSLRKIFRREPLHQKDILNDFTDTASGQPPESIVNLFARFIKNTFKPSSQTLLANGNNASDEIFSAIKGREKPILLWQLPLKERAPVGDALIGLPLGRDKETQYVILLGELPKGRFYGSHELEILSSLLRQANLLYENACLFDENLKYCRAILEEERRHLSEKEVILRDLHDGLGGIMTNIHVLSAIAQKRDDNKQTLSTISELSQEGLSEIRTFMHSLDNESLTWEGLVADLRGLGSRMIESNGIIFEFQSNLYDGRQKPGSLLYLNILRIYKESLTNAIKHSRAESVQARVEIGPEKISLCVEDDGVGIGQGGGKPGRGLANMQARAKDIGGNLVVLSGRGTKVELEVGYNMQESLRTT